MKHTWHRAVAIEIRNVVSKLSVAIRKRRQRDEIPPFKPLTARLMEKVSYETVAPWSNQAQREALVSPKDEVQWDGLGKRWRAKALLAWSLQLVVFAAWLCAFFWLWKRSARTFDDYWYYTALWISIPLAIYGRAWRRDKGKRLKPSPLFFWFSGR